MNPLVRVLTVLIPTALSVGVFLFARTVTHGGLLWAIAFVLGLCLGRLYLAAYRGELFDN